MAQRNLEATPGPWPAEMRDSPFRSPPKGLRPEIARLIEALARDAVRREDREPSTGTESFTKSESSAKSESGN
jgi:hypothetical protein